MRRVIAESDGEAIVALSQLQPVKAVPTLLERLSGLEMEIATQLDSDGNVVERQTIVLEPGVDTEARAAWTALQRIARSHGVEAVAETLQGRQLEVWQSVEPRAPQK